MKPEKTKFKNLSETAVDLLMLLLETNPEKRIGIDGVLSHPFLEGFKWVDWLIQFDSIEGIVVLKNYVLQKKLTMNICSSKLIW